MDRSYVIIIAIFALLAGILIGSALASPVTLDEGYGDSLLGPAISRSWDAELNVFCWSSSWGGMHCMSADDTDWMK